MQSVQHNPSNPSSTALVENKHLFRKHLTIERFLKLYLNWYLIYFQIHMIILYDYFKRCATIRKKRQGLLSAKCHVIMYIFFLINSNQCTFNIIIIILDLIIYNNKYIFIKQSNNRVKLVTLLTFDSHRTFRRRPSLF